MVADTLRECCFGTFRRSVAKLAQKLDDLDEGIRAPSLEPAPVTSRRPDPTIIWVARAHVVVAVKTMRRCDYDRDSAAEWVAKRRPGRSQPPLCWGP